METWDALTSRRNVRQYNGQPIAPEHLDRILEAGRRSPSSKNWQPWDFIAVTDPGRLTELSRVWDGAGHVDGSAATIALICPQPADEWQRVRANYDLGQATLSMVLIAADLGIGSCHSSVGDHDLARQLLGFPEDKLCAFLLSFGYPAGRPLAPIHNPDRRPFDQVVHYDRW